MQVKRVDSLLHRTGDSRRICIRPAEARLGSIYLVETGRKMPSLSWAGRDSNCINNPFIFKGNMALTKVQKETIVAKIRDAVKSAKTVVFVNFRGLGVSDTNAMRKELQSEGTRYTVAKKTLLRRALDESGALGDVPELPGEVAIAYGDDQMTPVSGIARFTKKHKDSLTILGGIFEGTFADRGKMETIASIPPMPILRGMFVNVINSPIQGLAVVLSEIAEKKN